MTQSPEQAKGFVQPQTLKGFCDYLPEEMIARNRVIEVIRNVYERYGFVPIDTPILEYLVTLIGTGGEEINKEIFRLESPEREPIGMRFDLTVPFARILAQYPDTVKLPFRRYHIGPVFRADKPGPGRFRQFTQFDIDAAGSKSVVIDAEIIAAMCDVLRDLGLSDGEYQIRVNSRGLMDALLIASNIDGEETRKHVLRVVDKLDKVGLDNIRKELGEGRVDESGDPIRGVGLESGTIDKILEFIAISSETRASVLETVGKVLPDAECTHTAIDEMKELAAALDSLGVGEDEVVFLPSLARGLDYYTGPVYETILPGAPQVGSIMGGGRYDHLVERFMPDPIPATGVSIGLDRLLAGLNAIGKIDTEPTTTKVLIITMRGVPMTELLKIARELRDNNISAEIYLGKRKAKMSDQLAYANHKNIPAAIIVGSDELESNQISIKDLVAGKEKRADISDRDEYRKSGKTGQQTIPREEMIPKLREIIGDE